MEEILFSEKLYQLRKEKNITQEELAQLIFVSRSAIAKWEQGRGTPTSEILEKIASVFNLSLTELIAGTEIKNVINKENAFSNLYNRAEMCLHDYDFTKADEIAEIILNQDLKQVKAYLIKAAVLWKVESIDQLFQLGIPLNNNPYYLKAVELATGEEKEKLIEVNESIKETIVKRRKQKCYQKALQNENENKFKEALLIYELIGDDANDKKRKLENKIYLLANSAIENHQYSEAKYLCSLILSNSNIQSLLDRISNGEIEDQYQTACNYYDNDKKKAMKIFKTIIDYKDSSIRYQELKKYLKKKNKKILIACLTSSFVLAGVITASCLIYKDKMMQRNYQDCMALINDKNFDKAEELIDKNDAKNEEVLKNFIESGKRLENKEYEYVVDSFLQWDYLVYSSIDGSNEIAKEVHSREDIFPYENIAGYDEYFEYVDYTFDIPKRSVNLIFTQDTAPIKYQIIYELDGGYFPSSVNPKRSYTILDEDFTLKSPEKKGYNFLYFVNEKDERVDIIHPKSLLSDIVLTAKYELATYNIIYKLKDGINNPNNPSTYVYLTEVTLFDPTKADCLFLGWYEDHNFTRQVTKIKSGTSGDVILYAKWATENLIINYNLNGGVNNENNITSHQYNDYRFKLLVPVKDGYDFLGWFLDENFTRPIAEIYDELHTKYTSIDLFAKWGYLKNNIVYHLGDGGFNHPDNKAVLNKREWLSLSAPYRSHYQFLGWYLDKDFTTEVKTIDYDENIKTHEIYAKWGEYIEDYKASIDQIYGNGTENNPYLIYDSYQWNTLAKKHKTGYISIQSDLNFEGKEIVPLGNVENGTGYNFSGNVLGNGYTISNFTVHNDGIVGDVTGLTTFDNIKFSAGDLQLTSENFLGINSHYTSAKVILRNISITGNFTSSSHVTIFGQDIVEVSNCSFEGKITLTPHEVYEIKERYVNGFDCSYYNSTNVLVSNFRYNCIIDIQTGIDSFVDKTLNLSSTYFANCQSFVVRDCNIQKQIVTNNNIIKELDLRGLSIGTSMQSLSISNCTFNLSADINKNISSITASTLGEIKATQCYINNLNSLINLHFVEDITSIDMVINQLCSTGSTIFQFTGESTIEQRMISDTNQTFTPTVSLVNGNNEITESENLKVVYKNNTI